MYLLIGMKKEEGRKEMRNHEKIECEKLWAREKYLVLSKSQNLYREMREYLKREDVRSEKIMDIIEKARKLEENRGEVENALLHVWGYFKKEVGEEERRKFFDLLKAYKEENIEKEIVLAYVRELLKTYPNRYLEGSEFLGFCEKKEI